MTDNWIIYKNGKIWEKNQSRQFPALGQINLATLPAKVISILSLVYKPPVEQWSLEVICGSKRTCCLAARHHKDRVYSNEAVIVVEEWMSQVVNLLVQFKKLS